jgi:hypothetical protein
MLRTQLCLRARVVRIVAMFALVCGELIALP